MSSNDKEPNTHLISELASVPGAFIAQCMKVFSLFFLKMGNILRFAANLVS